MFLDPMEIQKRYRHIGMLVAERHEKRTGKSLLEDEELEKFTDVYVGKQAKIDEGKIGNFIGYHPEFRVFLEITSYSGKVKELGDEKVRYVVDNLLEGIFRPEPVLKLPRNSLETIRNGVELNDIRKINKH